MFDFIGKGRWFAIPSLILIIVGVISLFAFGLERGIEFTGGSLVRVNFVNAVDRDDVVKIFTDAGHSEARVQGDPFDPSRFTIRSKVLTTAEFSTVKTNLQALSPFVTDPPLETVDPQVSGEKVRGAIIAVLVTCVGILVYVALAFRRLPKSWRYGTCAVIALAHDVVIPLGLFALLGVWFNMEVNLMFIAAMLAVLGYSVNNTCVIFDRIRENMTKDRNQDIAYIANKSINETLGRTMNSSLTTIFAMVVLYIYTGFNAPDFQNFILALLIGIVAGAYGSIFLSSWLIVVWNRGKWSGLWRKLPPPAKAKY
jgi:preprotein translocase subunit SecF